MINGNPAQRLLDILTQFKTSGQRSVYENWLIVFGLTKGKPETHHLFLKYMAEVSKLPDEVYDIIQTQFDSLIPTAESWLRSARAIVNNMELTATPNNIIKQYLKPEVMNTLMPIATTFEHALQDRIPDLQEDSLNKMREEFNSLVQDIIDSDFDQTVKEYLIFQINDILETLNKYQIYGPKPIIEKAKRSLGAIMLSQDIIDPDLEPDPQKERLLSKIINAFKISYDFADKGIKIFEIGQKINQIGTDISNKLI